MSKLTKFLKNPQIFFRDYFIKKYPLSFDEQNHDVFEEDILITNDFKLYNIDINTSCDPVDVVITWVNNYDPKWVKKLEYYKNQQNINVVNPISIDNARFENHGELFYVIKSINLFMPWVRNIFLVTDNQIPEFTLPNKVIVVDHNQIIDKTYLPTFNSHVIEAHLHNIPSLSENFIYFNDDVFVARELPKSHFLSGNNLTSLFLNKRNLDDMLKKGVNTPTLAACLNSRQLLLKKYGKNINIPLVHTYVPLKKSYFKYAWSYFSKDINGFISNRFRANNDINLATFLIPWMMYLEGRSILARDICYYFNIRSAFANTNYNILSHKKKKKILPHSICANDFSTQKASLLYDKNNLMIFLKSFYR
ncbi:capsule biosynthesis protein CapC [Gilliamella sp. Nev5-1]|uniref:stealth family protein n=1 Tax=unclassified Gilliamella TaxID=2685620 RepID=UPI00080E6D3C|nr:stealth family protein [Gilliamella apicola]OCG59018.1 capsule biosynthesis protein CapC [Gilliamella apicola]OCG71964.1 capsule biosynthesis protein CapC [Gilliamella apicola]